MMFIQTTEKRSVGLFIAIRNAVTVQKDRQTDRHASR